MGIAGKPLTKRAQDALQTREKLFSTALALFSEHGYDTVTVDDITQRAGVAKGTFYTHFSTKDAVLVEQFRMIDDQYKEAFGDVAESMPARQMLLLLMRTMGQYVVDITVNVIKIVYMNQIGLSQRPDILLNEDREFYRLLRIIAKKGIESGEFETQLEPEELARMFARLARSLLYDWCLADGMFDVVEESDRYFGLVLRGLGSEKK